MRSAGINTFASIGRRQPSPRRPAPVRPAGRIAAPPRSAGFVLLLWITLLAVFVYLSGSAGLARHDALYAALLAAVWGFYFSYERLLRVRLLGSLLRLIGRLVLLGGLVGFFGGVYFLIFTHD